MKLILFFLSTFLIGNDCYKSVQTLTCLLVCEIDKGSTIKNKYSNLDYIRYIDDIKRVEGYQLNVSDTLANGSINIESITDTIYIQNEKFLYKQCSLKLAKSQDKTIRKLKARKNSEAKEVVISWPLFSIDNKTAIFFVNKKCGYLCGSKELYIYVLSDGMWKLKDTVILAIS